MAEKGLDGEIKKVRTFKSELLEAKKAYENLVLTQAPTDQINAAAQAVANLRDESDDANDSVNALTGAGKFQAVTKSIAAVAGGFTAIQGAIGLAGGESEDFQKTIAKVQSAMALTQGLTALEDVGNSFKNVGKIGSDAFKSLGKNADGTFSAMKAGLKGLGIGLIVAALVLVIDNFEKIKKIVTDLVPGLGKVFEFIESATNAIKDFLGFSSEAERANEKREVQLKKEGESVDLLTKLLRQQGKERKALLLEESQLNKELQLARDKLNAAKEKKDQEAAAQEIKLLKITLAIKKGEIEKFDKSEKDNADKKEKDTADKAKSAAEKQRAIEKGFQDKKRDLLRTNELASLTDEREIAEKRQQFANEDRLREINALEVSEKKKKELRLLAAQENKDALDKITGDFDKKEKEKNQQKEKELLSFLATSERQKADLQIAELKKTADKILENKDLTDKQKEEVEEAHLAAVAKINKDYDTKLAEDKSKTALEALDTRLLAERNLIIKGLEDGTMSLKQAREKERDLELGALEERLRIAKEANKGIEEADAALYAFKKDQRDQDRAQNIEVINESFELANQLGNSLMALSEQRTQRILADESLSAAEKTRLAKEQFENQKKLQFALAVIDGAKAITAILSVPDFTLGVASAIRIAAAAASTGFALATISASKFTPPSSGGSKSKFEEGGMLMGPSHDRGGIRNYFGEMEGGEFVVNRRSSAAFLPLLEQINTVGNENPSMAMGQGSAGQQPIIKTYVVASEVSSQQEADKRVADLAAL